MPEAPSTRPSIFLTIVSLAGLAACATAVAFGISSICVTWDPCAVIGGLALLPIPVGFGIQQYRATFRSDAGASLVTAVISLGLGAFALFGFATNLGEALVEIGQVPRTLLLPFAGIGGAFLLVGWANLTWRNRLLCEAAGKEREQTPWYRSRRDLVTLIVAIVFVTGLATYFLRSTPPRFAVGISRDDAPFDLPKGAHDIAYCLGHRGTVAFEFTTDEAGFIAWVESGIGSFESESAGVRLKPYSGPCRITRWFDIAPGAEGPDYVEILDGMSYVWEKRDRGVYATFDRATGRAYYYARSH